jgi:hypothetical protein
MTGHVSTSRVQERVCIHCGRVGSHDFVGLVRMDGTKAGYCCTNGNACLRRYMKRSARDA